MKTIHQILVPTDFSACSMGALEHAAAWAERFAAVIDLIHVWEVPAFTVPGAVLEAGLPTADLLELIRAESERALQNFLAEARAKGIPVRSTHCVAGSPALCIVATAARGEYDMIVLGTHGRTGLNHLLLGSVAERVVRLAKCPVVTVRGGIGADVG